MDGFGVMRNKNASGLLPALVSCTILMITGAATAADTGDRRASVTTHMSRAERDLGSAGVTAEHDYPALDSGATTGKQGRATTSAKVGAAIASSPDTDFWVYAADVVLFNDHDGDGHYHGIDLLFDVDTYYPFADVYAVVYLSLDGGPWNEYAATDAFTISGASADDEYVIVTELLSGYPNGSYDLLIEVFDADSDAFLASYGPVDTPALAFLPLEDRGRDVPPGNTTVIVTEQGGGAQDPLSLLLLALAALAVVRRRAPG